MLDSIKSGRALSGMQDVSCRIQSRSEVARNIEEEALGRVGLIGRTIEIVVGKAKLKVVIGSPREPELEAPVISAYSKIGVGKCCERRVCVDITVGVPGRHRALFQRIAFCGAERDAVAIVQHVN